MAQMLRMNYRAIAYHTTEPSGTASAVQCLSGEQSAYQQVPVITEHGTHAAKQPGVVGGTTYDETELDALAEIERIERESAIELENDALRKFKIKLLIF